MVTEQNIEQNQKNAFFSAHAYLLLDGSGSMKDLERYSSKPKHRAVATMVQELINELHKNPELSNTRLTIICYDGQRIDDIRIENHDVTTKMYYKPHYTDDDLDQWDPIIGHGTTTPIGRALTFARELAENWVLNSTGDETRRAVIYLMTDGMREPDTEPDGSDEKKKIEAFNAHQEQLQEKGEYKGKIRLFTIGYYQYPEGENSAEGEGRKLLKKLVHDEDASKVYKETANASEIAGYVVRTIPKKGR